MRRVDALTPAGVLLDPGRKLGVRGLVAWRDVDHRAELLASELGEPRAQLGDEVEGESVPARRDRAADARLHVGALAGREVRQRGALAVPDERVAAIVEPVIAEQDLAVPRDRARVLELHGCGGDGSRVHGAERPVVPTNGERPRCHRRLV